MNTPSPCECDNCGHVCDMEELNEVQDLHQRCDPGDTMPAGECPVCGCLAFPQEVAPPPRVVITVEGGVVQGVLADRPVNVTLIDYDCDGDDGDDIRQVPQTGSDKTEPAFVAHYPADLDPERCQKLADL